MTAAILVVLACVLGFLAGFILASVALFAWLGHVYRWCDADEWETVGAILSGAATGADLSWPGRDS